LIAINSDIPYPARMNVFVGTSGYAYREWKGKFYPDDLPAKRMLNFYAQHFGSVEINGTFRRIPKASVFEAWMKEVPASFKFALKAPQQITHIKRLNEVDAPLEIFLNVAQTLGTQLGPVLFQLPPNFKADVPRLTKFLDLLPDDFKAAFEFRHESWLTDEVFELLKKQNAALCVAESDETIAIPFEATADWGYLRLRKDDYTAGSLKKWAARIREQKWSEAFVYFKHEETGSGPKFAKKFLEVV
jgi:uncharacterized protein YecE (DUF72 family)